MEAAARVFARVVDDVMAGRIFWVPRPQFDPPPIMPGERDERVRRTPEEQRIHDRDRKRRQRLGKRLQECPGKVAAIA